MRCFARYAPTAALSSDAAIRTSASHITAALQVISKAVVRIHLLKLFTC